jgi:hypothetical protein
VKTPSPPRARTKSSVQVGKKTGVGREAGPPPLLRAAPVPPPSGPFREAAAAGAPKSYSLKSTSPGLSGGVPPDSVVGGRLQRHTDFWDRWCQKGSSVPDIVRYGARLDFEKSPPTTTSPSPVQTPTDPTWVRALRTEVQALLDKGAVSVVGDHSSPAFTVTFSWSPRNRGSGV